MKFATKKYTRPVLHAAVKSINVNNFTDVNTFANALSPRAGRSSAQLAALRSAVGCSLNKLFVSRTARFNKSNVLAALKD